MNLYLLRHGIAEDRAPSGRDEDRELTGEGRDKLAGLLRRAALSGLKPDTVLTSPYKRAAQTAKMASRILGAPEPIPIDSAVPHSSPRDLWTELRDFPDAQEILLASHEPLLSSAVAYLLNSPGLQVEMKKGALVAIGFAGMTGEPRGILRWMLTARLCS